MAKNLKEFIQCGRDPVYLKNGDIITEELAWEVVGQEGYADGCLDQEFEITQSRIVEDIIGGEGVYETIYRESPDHPCRGQGSPRRQVGKWRCQKEEAAGGWLQLQCSSEGSQQTHEIR